VLTPLLGLAQASLLAACSAQAPSNGGAAPSPAPGTAPSSVTAFWRVPLQAADGAVRGDILATQPRADAPAGSKGWNVIYVSEGATGSLVYVSGEVYVPDNDAAERKLVVWNHGTSGSQDSCAPSRNDQYEGPGRTRAPGLEDLLRRGYVVAMSDYQGLGTPGATEYLNGPTQGKAALDIARAARKLPEARAGARVAMYGFSQGGQTSLWAAHLASTYAPELQLLGVVATAPAARHLDLSFYDLGIRENSGYFISRMSGLAVGHPEVKLRDILTPAGLEMLDTQTWDCYEIFRQAAALTEPYARREALQPGTPWRALLEANDRFLPIPSEVPIYVVQGDRDVDVPVELTRELVRDLCAGGSRVEYREHAGVNHMDMNDQAAPDMGPWFDARWAGTAAPDSCASAASGAARP
jgi:pimeloyl-ACP methyl ester carboxylesterase